MTTSFTARPAATCRPKESISGLVGADLAEAASPAGAVEEFPTPGAVTTAALEAAPVWRCLADRQFKDPRLASGTETVSSSSCMGATNWKKPKSAPSDSAPGVRPLLPRSRRAMERRAGKPGRGKGHDQESPGAGGNFRRPRNSADRQRHDRSLPCDRRWPIFGTSTWGAELDITRSSDFRRFAVNWAIREPVTASAQDRLRDRGGPHSSSSGTKIFREGSARSTPTDQKQKHFMVMGSCCTEHGPHHASACIEQKPRCADGIIWP